ncbi:unnamed protein product [marine sediment metagenome]|uniref:Uncharacterized protein n=1 Tax=marine sediment metagenome TaxID=412755 RepID=X0XGW8_9ZZZZ
MEGFKHPRQPTYRAEGRRFVSDFGSGEFYVEVMPSASAAEAEVSKALTGDDEANGQEAA